MTALQSLLDRLHAMPIPHSLSLRAPKVLRSVDVFARARLPSRHGEFEIVSFVDEAKRTLDDVAILANLLADVSSRADETVDALELHWNEATAAMRQAP